MKAMTITELNDHLQGLVRNERKLTLEIISYISLFDRCGGPLKMGYTSMHEYLTRALGYSDDQAYRRLKAARLYNQVPQVAEKLKEGSLNLTQISEAQKSFELVQKETGAPVSLEKKNEILNSIAHTNNFQTKAILQERLDLKPIAIEKVKPQSDQSVRLEITLSQEQFEKLKQIKSLLSHQIPSQNTTEVLNALFDQYLDKQIYTKKIKTTPENKVKSKPIPLNKVKSSTDSTSSESPKNIEDTRRKQTNRSFNSEVDRPLKNSRYIPAKVRKLVYQRAKGCCEFFYHKGERCSSRYQLEVDHIQPFSLNGSNELENLRLVCSIHNNYLASQMNIGFELTNHFITQHCGAS